MSWHHLGSSVPHPPLPLPPTLIRSSLSVLLPAALLLQAMAADAPHVPRAPCVLRSSVLASALIQLSLPGGRHVPVWDGHLVLQGRRILAFRLGMFQGYGSRIWSIPGDTGRGEYAIAFAQGQPLMAGSRRARSDAFLFPGLGSTLHARSDGRNPALSRAGEGFWQVGDGCRDPYLFGEEPGNLTDAPAQSRSMDSSSSRQKLDVQGAHRSASQAEALLHLTPGNRLLRVLLMELPTPIKLGTQGWIQGQ